MIHWPEPDYAPGGNDILFHDSTPCALAVEDRGIGALIAGAHRNRDAGLERAAEVYSKLYPSLALGIVRIPTQCN